jgi:hypothetical protein
MPEVSAAGKPRRRYYSRRRHHCLLRTREERVGTLDA